MDTTGSEKFDTITSQFYQNADCCLLIYDITSKQSFERIKTHYIKEIKDKCKNFIKVLLLGNKKDLEKLRQVSIEEGVKLAEENGFIFMESSCQNNYNVSDAFTTLIEMTNSELLRIGREKNIKLKIENKKTLDKDNGQSSSSKCC